MSKQSNICLHFDIISKVYKYLISLLRLHRAAYAICRTVSCFHLRGLLGNPNSNDMMKSKCWIKEETRKFRPCNRTVGKMKYACNHRNLHYSLSANEATLYSQHFCSVCFRCALLSIMAVEDKGSRRPPAPTIQYAPQYRFTRFTQPCAYWCERKLNWRTFINQFPYQPDFNVNVWGV